jgi:hypothetical protein
LKLVNLLENLFKICLNFGWNLLILSRNAAEFLLELSNKPSGVIETFLNYQKLDIILYWNFVFGLKIVALL